MSTATRKARKRAGIPFRHPAKTPTPVTERSFFTALVYGPAGTRFQGRLQPRSAKKIAKALAARTEGGAA